MNYSNNIEDYTGLHYVECKRFLRTGELPGNFRERVDSVVQLFDEGIYWCRNCGGVRDMNFVFRDWEAPIPSWCPDCVEEIYE